jgi:hypothetical protein
MFVWAITASEWLQWIVMVLALFWWNLLLVRAGKERTLGTPGEGLSEMSAGIVLCGAALLALSAILIYLAEDTSLYLGPKAISFAIVSLPVMIWANVHLRSRQERA